MNQRQLYWLMFLLMALVLILDKPAKVVPVPMPDPMEDRTELPSNSKKLPEMNPRIRSVWR